MQFAMLPERLRWLIPLFMLPVLALSACTTPIVYNRPASSCSKLIPEALRKDTDGAPMPAEAAVAPWIIFGVSQTGQLQKSNVDRHSAIEIVERCEARDAEAEKATTKHKRLK